MKSQPFLICKTVWKNLHSRPIFCCYWGFFVFVFYVTFLPVYFFVYSLDGRIITKFVVSQFYYLRTEKKFIKTSKMLQLLLSPFSRQVARYWNQLQACGAVIKQSLGSSVVFFFPVFTISPWDHVMALFLPALTIWSMCSRRSNISVNHLQVYIKSLTSFSIANDIAI